MTKRLTTDEKTRRLRMRQVARLIRSARDLEIASENLLEAMSAKPLSWGGQHLTIPIRDHDADEAWAAKTAKLYGSISITQAIITQAEWDELREKTGHAAITSGKAIHEIAAQEIRVREGYKTPAKLDNQLLRAGAADRWCWRCRHISA